MNEAWDKELLKELEELLSEAGLEVTREDIAGNDVIVAEYDGENEPEDCNVSVMHLTEDSTEISVMISVMSGLDEKQSDDIAALIPYLNRYLSVGSFGITKQDGYFWFGCSNVIDENTERSKLLKVAAATVDIAYGTAAEAVRIVLPVVNGETPVSELMNDDTSIIQF